MKQKFLSKTPNFVFNWRGALVLLGGFILVNFLLAFVVAGFNFAGNKNVVHEEWFLILGNLLTFLGAIFAFDVLICRPTTGRKLNFTMRSSNFVTYLLVFPMMMGMMLIVDVITAQIPTTGPIWGDLYQYFEEIMSSITGDFGFMLLMAVIMAPLLEEVIFRGIIQRGLIKGGMKPGYAILIASVAFGLVHGNPWQFVGATLLGIVMGVVYHKTKTLLLPILLHAFNNLISTLLYFYAGDHENFSTFLKMDQWMILGIGVIIFAIFYILFTRYYRVHHSE